MSSSYIYVVANDRISFFFHSGIRSHCVCVPYVCLVSGGQKRASNSLELKLWTVLSHHECVKNQTHVLNKSSDCPETTEIPSPLSAFCEEKKGGVSLKMPDDAEIPPLPTIGTQYALGNGQSKGV